MLIALHKNARTTPAVRAEIAASDETASIRSTHAPCILLLYGSVRERSYSRLLTEEAAQILRALGAETRIFDPRGLPLPDAEPAAILRWWNCESLPNGGQARIEPVLIHKPFSYVKRLPYFKSKLSWSPVVFPAGQSASPSLAA